ncbi:MAG: ATP-dependent DNA helicase RecG [Nitrospirae bacterium]|nr:ATP-dependent DNA helicase RecG [Nitrospirota bacterium]MCL5285596.1 ATP-dependent DNA helicase RecG [Nitrospirota bacterium]
MSGIALRPLKLTAGLDQCPAIGPRRLARLERRGIRNVLDLLYTFPFRYEDRRVRVTIADLREGTETGLLATVRTIRKKIVPKLRAPVIEAEIFDRTGSLPVVWFGQEYLLKHLSGGTQAFFFGKIEYSRYSRSLVLKSPVTETVDPEEGFRKSYHVGRIVPVYREEEGISSAVFRRLAGDVLRSLWGETFDPLPPEVRKDAGLMEWFPAIVEMHFPKETDRPLEELLTPDYPPRSRLIFEEFFLLEYLMMVRRKSILVSGRSWELPPEGDRPVEAFERGLPFPLTRAQRLACRDILGDLASTHPMNRFLLGDVGSGKTLVAAFAILQALRSGRQAAFLAPTEILAQQHARTLGQVFGPAGGKDNAFLPVLLSQSVRGGERRRILSSLASGEQKLVVGTHAILEEGVPFHSLGMVVIDEQHKFGVAQRRALATKGQSPDVLVMTATPIPRSLALSYYGDLEISLLDELPPGRQPVTTRVLKDSGESFWRQKILPVLRRKEQVFVVFPLIEESDTVEAKNATEAHVTLSALFPEYRVALLTGRMEGEEKDAVMEGFRKGDFSILVATTVIEVGVDIPNATIMIVENAERFGLAQLHQLRGRIGRGGLPGTFYLVPGPSTGEEGRQRLKILETYSDGFHVAEEDLRMRGPGEFMGVRQSGLPMFALADLVRDTGVLVRAREAASRFVGEAEGRTESAWERSRLEEFIRLRYKNVDQWLSTR